MAQIPPEILADIARRRLGIEETARTGRERTIQDYTTDIGRLGEQNIENVQSLNDTLAGQGIFHSGIRINEQGKLSRQYGQGIADLETGKGRGLADIESTRTGALTQLQGEEGRALAEAARVEAEQELQRELARAQAAALAAVPPPPVFLPPPPAPVYFPPPPSPPSVTYTQLTPPRQQEVYYNPKTGRTTTSRPAQGRGIIA